MLGESMDDYYARLNLEGDRNILKANRNKIDYVLNKYDKILTSPKKVCDIGLGEGYALEMLYKKGLEVTGIDHSKYLITFLKNRYVDLDMDINLILSDIQKLETNSGQYDIVTCFDVLEHIPKDGLNATIKKISELSKQNGCLIGTLPFKENLEEGMVKCPNCGHNFHRVGHFHSFNNIEDINIMLDPYFEVIEYGSVPPKGVIRKTISVAKKIKSRLSNTMVKSTIYFIAQKKTRK